MSKLREKLRSELQEIEWTALKPHLARDAVITVSPQLDLLEVAESVASDDKSQLEAWVQGGLVGKPTAAELALWETQLERKFRFIILSPFVLIQHLAN
jgi:hypothetical protein